LAKLSCQNCNQEFEAKRSDAKWCSACRGVTRGMRERCYERRCTAKCMDCGKPISRRSARCHLCDNKSRVESNRGENNPNWKGGRSRQSDGYVYILGKRQGRKHRYQLEHIMVWEQANGLLPQGWIVHHMNGIRDDNRLENLVAMPRKRHSPTSIIEPHQARIRQLEAELRNHCEQEA
jgi:hypothetical protein